MGIISFAVVESNGRTFAADPKGAAYRYAAHLVNMQGRRYSMTFHADGAVSVASAGLQTLTFHD